MFESSITCYVPYLVPVHMQYRYPVSWNKTVKKRKVPVVVFIALFPAEEGVGSVSLVHRITVPAGFQHFKYTSWAPRSTAMLYMPRVPGPQSTILNYI
jgi:hypothetical protein